jgi:hypothetical protein
MAFIVFLLLIIANKYICDSKVIENIPCRLGSPGMITGTVKDTEDQWTNIPNGKMKMLKKLNNREHFNSKLNNNDTGDSNNYSDSDSNCDSDSDSDNDSDSDSDSDSDDNHDNHDINSYYHSNNSNYSNNSNNGKNIYNTNIYPKPIDDRPDLSQCQPCPTKCKPCIKKKTILVHKLSPKLMKQIKRELKK